MNTIKFNNKVHKNCYHILLMMLFTSLVLISCENDMKTVNLISAKQTMPTESGKDVEMIFSENAKVQMILKTPQLDRIEGNNPIVELPKGVKVFFYDTLMNITSQLTADYAIKYDKENKMEGKRNVVFINEKGETLNTEHLIWDMSHKRIFTKTKVKITTGDEVLFGSDFSADERFNQWVINQPSGIIKIKKD